LALVLLTVLPPGCEAPQREAREQATQRWNIARAEVKARLAADQFEAGNVRAAESELAEACRLAPNHPEFVPLRAKVLLAEGQTAAARDLLEGTQAAGKTQAEIDYYLGVVWQQQQRWEEALTAYRRACGLDPDEVGYLVAATQARLQLGRATEALQTLTAAAERFGWTAAYQAALAECHEQLGDWPAASALWQRVAGAPGAPTLLRERLAVALFRAGRYADAVAELRFVLEDAANPAPEPLRRLLIESYVQTGQCAAAREQAQVLVQRTPNDVRSHALLARTLSLAGDEPGALRAIRRALALNENDLASLELGIALAWRAGEQADASVLATRLLALDDQNPVAQRVLSGSGSAQ
jgi:tetratricopeptide (TPR) repeat protein